jgi:hypothetical protein
MKIISTPEERKISTKSLKDEPPEVNRQGLQFRVIGQGISPGNYRGSALPHPVSSRLLSL